ncbi:polyhydroxyalkanoate synthesis regulator phasin [Pullulanibacillus pueri]|nr:hypothetical protein [Pullulanibacillus pueri]MBM7681356.1 polyhydroxyalkanoate synthesis regulator phasin [Pullulanibacillus pueri]
MNELIKKGFYLGLGATIASKEKAEKYIKDFVKNGELAPQEARKMLEELSEKGRGKQEDWSDNFREEIQTSFKKLGFVTQEEFNELKEQVKVLEEKLENLKG